MTRMCRGALLGALAGIVLPAAGAEGATTWGPLLRLSLEGRQDTELKDGAQVGSLLMQPSGGFWIDSPTVASQARYSADLRGYPVAGGGAYVPRPNHRFDALQDVALNDVTGLKLHQHAELVGDPTSLSRLAVARSFGQTTWFQLEGSFHRALSRRDLLYLGYEGNAAYFTDPALHDGLSHAPYAWWRRQLDARNALGLRGRVQLFDDLGGPLATSYEPSLTYEYRFTGSLHLEIEGGPAVVERAATDPRVLPRGKAVLQNHDMRSTATLGYERTLLGATGFPGAVWADLVTGYYNYRFTAAWSLQAGAGVFRNGSDVDGPSAVTGALTSASVAYRFAPDLALGVSWRLALQDEGAAARGTVPTIYRNIFAAGVTWDFDADRVPRGE